MKFRLLARPLPPIGSHQQSLKRGLRADDGSHALSTSSIRRGACTRCLAATFVAVTLIGDALESDIWSSGSASAP
jgi:hypothetical protein